MSNSRNRHFRPSSVTQHPEPTRAQQSRRQRIYRHDTVPGRSAREWFAHLRPILLDSRPVLEPAYEVKYPKTMRISRVDKKTGKKTWRFVQYEQRVTRPARFGRPTFQNIITPEGEHA